MKRNMRQKLSSVTTVLTLSLILIGCGDENSRNRLELRLDNQNILSDYNSDGYRLCRGSNGYNTNNRTQYTNQNSDPYYTQNQNYSYGSQIQIEYSSTGNSNNNYNNNRNIDPFSNNNNGNFSSGNFSSTSGYVNMSLLIGQGQEYGSSGTNGYYLQNFNINGVNGIYVNAQECSLKSLNENNDTIEGRIDCNLAYYGSNTGYTTNDERYQDDRNNNGNYQTNVRKIQVNFSCQKY